MISKIERLRVLILLLAAVCSTLPSWGVLSEYNLDQTLISLSADMKALQQNVRKDIRRFENRQKEFCNEIEHLDEMCDETSVMLYSQDERYLYGTLQATQGMKNVIRRIRSQKEKLTQLETDLSIITNPYGELSNFLKGLETKLSTPKSRDALYKSVVIADSLKLSVDSCISSVAEDKTKYRNLVSKADRLEIYNNSVMSHAQTIMFGKGGEPLWDFCNHFSTRWCEFKDDLIWRFFTGQSDLEDWNSKEDRMYEYMDIKFYISLVLAIYFYLLARFTRFCPGWIAKKRIYWTLCFWLTVNVVGLIVIMLIMGFAPMLQIIVSLDCELFFLALLILTSSTVRLKKSQIWRTILSYLPMFALTYILIEYRQDLVPISTVTFTVPFFFFLAVVGQTVIMALNLKKLDNTDRQMAWVNITVIASCLLLICFGYTILGSLVFLLWIGLVTGILFFELAKAFINKKQLVKNSVASMTVRLLIYPLAIPAIVFASISWVAHIYNFTTWFLELTNTPFVNMPDKIGVISIAKILYIYGLGVIVNYGLTLVKHVLRRDAANQQGQVAVWISIGNIITWLCYIIVVILILDINKAGLIAAVGGASVGIGFALKNTFENFFSGMSLMTGRVRPGDILEYEGVRGKVLDIGIISTRMETEDGPIMTMPNRQLFEKNFKNMTRNHSVELRHIVFDISENNDPKLVRKIILDSFQDIDGVDENRKHVVIMRNFGSGVMRVELKVWIDSEKYLATEPAVREAIFEAFRSHDIHAATFLQQIAAKSAYSFMTD
jgi:small-conductance mechanosensitive channel